MAGPYRILLYVEQTYSFDILRPLQTVARSAGHEVRWLTLQDASDDWLRDNEESAGNIRDAIKWQPDAVVVPGDRVPAFLPGLKVWVGHGINEDKRGNLLAERGLFDLYCARDPEEAAYLRELGKSRPYFEVAETGWLKLDAILNHESTLPAYTRPAVLFASTFTPRLSGADDLADEIQSLAATGEWQWLVTLHPKTDPAIVGRYKAMQNDNLRFFGTDSVIDLLTAADVMVSDNSSILQEFLILKKPVVTYRNRDPQPCMIDITEPTQLRAAVEQALDPATRPQAEIDAYGPGLTPFLDGASAGRVLAAITELLESGWRDRKPRNLWRNIKMRRQLGYYGLS